MPHFTRDLRAARKPINARAETLATSGMFRGAPPRRRYLVPADAFYEWRAVADGKQPYATARRDGRPMVFAGLWEGWRAPDGKVLRTYTIITTAANATMTGLHERMPVILEPPDWPAWLGDAGGDPAALLRPAADGCCACRLSAGRSTACETPSHCWTRSTIRTRRRRATRRPGRTRPTADLCKLRPLLRCEAICRLTELGLKE